MTSGIEMSIASFQFKCSRIKQSPKATLTLTTMDWSRLITGEVPRRICIRGDISWVLNDLKNNSDGVDY